MLAAIGGSQREQGFVAKFRGACGQSALDVSREHMMMPCEVQCPANDDCLPVVWTSPQKIPCDALFKVRRSCERSQSETSTAASDDGSENPDQPRGRFPQYRAQTNPKFDHVDCDTSARKYRIPGLPPGKPSKLPPLARSSSQPASLGRLQDTMSIRSKSPAAAPMLVGVAAPPPMSARTVFAVPPAAAVPARRQRLEPLAQTQALRGGGVRPKQPRQASAAATIPEDLFLSLVAQGKEARRRGGHIRDRRAASMGIRRLVLREDCLIEG
mmetsp:Transcript_80678/g.233329  ORF Transcript_80678/g.233329 Transcript_80678/m.233329 type:complete len:270 (+) Transcript_80678:61-870(+)|eukprot:CAMPEP_0170213828 /NCGR_PEP_ID=MMETSP0116_2-20130129/6540_1 /TAXON_ID=400756 /ORGANISM="Durinskia baltica, Strain CSIRO CS-38" /LENGTH=269 /DNA_ID=CAMNT_0010464383 /DNA_START=53 /DNA_END=862 /DNA_ORIENTATION=-